MTTWTITHPAGGAHITTDATEAREIIDHITSTGVAPTVEIADAPDADTYTITVTEARQRANAMPRPRFEATITDPVTGGTVDTGPCWTEQEARDRAAALIDGRRTGTFFTELARFAANRAALAAEQAAAAKAAAPQPRPEAAPQSRPVAPLATTSQIDYIIALLSRRARTGEGGGFMSTRSLYNED